MRKKNKSILLASIVLLLLLMNGLSGDVKAKTMVNPSLFVGKTDEAVPTDEITRKYHSTLPQELAIGRSVAYMLLQKYDNKLNTDPELNKYVNLVGQSIAKRASKRPQINYRFGIIETPEINAFACPGGYIFVTTGLLKVLYDENELAAVLGHEMGHIEHGDGLRDVMTHKADKYAKCKVDKIEEDVTLLSDVASSLPYAGWYASYYSPKNIARSQIGRQIGRIGGGYAGYIARDAAYSATGAAVDVGWKGLKKAFKLLGKEFIKRQFEDPLTPEIEFDADAFSTEAIAKAGYDPRGVSSFLKTIQYIKSASSANAGGNTAAQGMTEGGAANMFTYRHPPVKERIEMVDVLVDSGDLEVKNPKAGEDKFFEERYDKALKALK